jgi:hypothetical protein
MAPPPAMIVDYQGRMSDGLYVFLEKKKFGSVYSI